MSCVECGESPCICDSPNERIESDQEAPKCWKPCDKCKKPALKCIEYDSESKRFICKPIEGYNVRTRVLERNKELGFCCSCQGYQPKLKAYNLDPTLPIPSCSHVGALKVWFVERNKAHKWGAFKE